MPVDDHASHLTEEILQELEYCQAHPESVGRFGEKWTKLPSVPTPDPQTTERFFQCLAQYIEILENGHPHHAKRLQEPSGFFRDPLAYGLLRAAKYVWATKNRDSVWEQLQHSAAALETFYQQSQEVTSGIHSYREQLRGFIDTTTKILNQKTDWGAQEQDGILLRDRLTRRLGALQSLTMVLDQQAAQAKLAAEQVLHHLDLYYRIRDLFRPIIEQNLQEFYSATNRHRKRAWREYRKSLQHIRKETLPYVGPHPAAVVKPKPAAMVEPTASADPR